MSRGPERSRTRLAATLVLLLSAASPLLACPVCFQIEPGPVASGVRAAVIVLMAVTVSVLGGFAVFIVNFARRAKIDLGCRFPPEVPNLVDFGGEIDTRGRF